jgi:hypothetical protein
MAAKKKTRRPTVFLGITLRKTKAYTRKKVVEKKKGSMDPKRKEHFKVECMHQYIFASIQI